MGIKRGEKKRQMGEKRQKTFWPTKLVHTIHVHKVHCALLLVVWYRAITAGSMYSLSSSFN